MIMIKLNIFILTSLQCETQLQLYLYQMDIHMTAGNIFHIVNPPHWLPRKQHGANNPIPPPLPPPHHCSRFLTLLYN